MPASTLIVLFSEMLKFSEYIYIYILQIFSEKCSYFFFLDMESSELKNQLFDIEMLNLPWNYSSSKGQTEKRSPPKRGLLGWRKRVEAYILF